ncbi:MAG TPA: M35 family metallo-endopeptidase [Candidatus Saccharimonadia bacterium]|nr:M35 family metallo-endopeptidase [Candidatus Saccharimonadia bacterium]
MHRSIRSAALGLGLLASSLAFAANPLHVDLVPVSGKAAHALGAVRISMTNTSGEAVRVLKYQTPFFGVEADLFDVSLGKDDVEYVGMLAKRGIPSADDFMTFAAGERRSAVVELAKFYEFGTSGQYAIRYDTVLQGAAVGNAPIEKRAGVPERLQSPPIALWVDGADIYVDPATEPSFGLGVKVGGPTPAFVKCTVDQQSQLHTALESARGYSEGSKNYMNAGQATARYTTWFGAYTAGRFATVDSHFEQIDSALDLQTMTFDCGCKKSYYAYVYPSQPYRIYFCRAFWSAPNTGTDSRAGTIIHEVSHFDVVANTDDVVYGQAGAKNLAISDPDGAVRNADSHEYHAENTPVLQ